MKPWAKIDPETTVSDLANLLDRNSTGSALVMDAGKPLGIVTERDILKKIVVPAMDPREIKVKNIMNSPVVTIDADESVSQASDLMDRNRIRRLVVVENGRVVGKITTNIVSVNYRYRIARSLSDHIPYHGRFR
jgi:CBS domain-containing protein